MSEEEMQRKMEFIVAQQAQFAADIQTGKEERAADAKLWREKYNGLTDALTTVVGMFGKLVQSQERTAAQLAATNAQLAELAVKQAETDERLNIFVNVVERYISEHRNGKGEGDKPPAAGA